MYIQTVIFRILTATLKYKQEFIFFLPSHLHMNDSKEIDMKVLRNRHKKVYELSSLPQF